MPASARPGFMTGAASGPRIQQLSRLYTDFYVDDIHTFFLFKNVFKQY